MPTNFILSILLSLTFLTNAQQKNFTIPDTLSAKRYGYFSEAILSHPENPGLANLYANSWLSKAKTEKNFNQMAQAYKALLYSSGKKLRLLYADSMLVAAKNTPDTELIGSAYLTKGIIHYDRKEQMKALDNYLIADEYISGTSNQYLVHKVKFGIAQVKYYLGFYDEAIALFRECISYFKDENDRAYLNSLHCLGLCYNRIGQYQLCTEVNQLGIAAGVEFNNPEMLSYFMHSEGVNQYCKNNYRLALSKLEEALPGIIANKDFANETVALYYM
jgi:tetratricopeptide (TPR) repeat protein